MIIPKMQPDCSCLNEGLALFGSSASECAPMCATSKFPLNTSHAVLLSSLRKTEPTCNTAVKCARHLPLSVQKPVHDSSHRTACEDRTSLP